MHWFHMAARAVRGQLKGGALAAHRAWSGPGRERDLLVQAVKAALAAFLAWLAAGWWLQAPVAFVAPWVAIVLVESTVYRSIAHGLQQLAAIATGTVVATAVALALNSTLPAMAVVLPATVLLGNWRRLGSQGIYAATGALFVLTGPSVGFATSAARIGEAVFGALVGIAVNALIRPPTYLRSPRAALHDAAEEARSVMEDVADGLDGADWDAARAGEWHERALHLSRLVDQARSALGWSRESLRVNPRRRARAVTEPGSAYDDAVTVFDYVAVHTAGVTRTVLETAGEDRTLSWPGAPLARPYAAFLRQTAEAVRLYSEARFGDGSAEELGKAVQGLRDTLGELRRRFPDAAGGDPEDLATYGTLLTQARRLTDQLAPVDPSG
ncbi:FUSC family protein [Streptomyces griseoaurantiacus]|nr:FUSC family protein [Streptomyces griseoaurantiacus]